MEIQGPIPPTNPSQGIPGSPQLSDYAQASLCSQLAAAAPTTGVAPPTGLNLTAAQQNTFWFLRMYGDLMMLCFIEHNPSLYPSGYAQNFINDLQFIYTQASTGNTGFDPQLLQDLQNDINNPNAFSQPATVNNIITLYNDIIIGQPGPGYDPNTPYNFQELTPDDMYNYYLVQIGTAIFNASDNQPQNNFWESTPTTTTLLGSELGQFMCTYFVQRDGWGTPALAQDLKNFQTLMNPIMTFVSNYTTQAPALRALNAAFQSGTDPNNNWFKGLAGNMTDLVNGTWDFGPIPSSLPTGSNNTPPPWWDVTSSTEVQWSYVPDYTFLFMNDSNLAFYLQSLNS